MTPEFEQQLRDLRARQERLHEALRALDEDLDRALRSAQHPVPAPPPAAFQPSIDPPDSLPPPLPAFLKRGAESAPAREEAPPAPISSDSQPPAEAPPPAVETPISTPPPTPPPSSAPSGPPPPREAFEFRLVQVWFVRIGVVVFLTALVLLGNYAYQEWIANLGPSARAFALALLSGGVLGAGALLEKKRESLRQFARVLMAGGFAGIYYTAYASHFVPALRWIESPVAAGVLLVALAGMLVWLAERKQSQTLAVLGIGLAWYSCVINPVGWFTLASNLVLSAAAVFFLLRNRWTALSCTLLPAVYGAYAYWQSLRVDAGGSSDAWLGCLFCTTYWITFTFPVFFKGRQPLALSSKIWLLTANNFAWFGLTAWSLPTSGLLGNILWLWSAIIGALLLALDLCARRYLPSEREVALAYRIQGLALLTLAITLKWQGAERALLLAAEGLILQAGSRSGSVLLGRAGLAVTLLAAVFGLESLSLKEGEAGNPLQTGALLAGFFLVQALIHRPLALGPDWKQPSGKLLPAPSFYALLSVLAGTFTLANHLSATWQPLAFGAAALAFILVGLAAWAPETAFLGQLFVLAGHGAWLLADKSTPWWSPLGLLAATLACAYWWPRQRRFSFEASLGSFGQAVLAFLAVFLVFRWLDGDLGLTREGWMVAGGFLTLAFLFYGLATANGWLVGFGQLFLLVAVGAFLIELLFTSSAHLPRLSASLIPLALMLGISVAARELGGPAGEGLPGSSRAAFGLIARFYRYGTMAMVLLWCFRYVEPVHQVWFLGAASLIAMLWARFQFEGPRMVFSLLLAALALARLLFGLRNFQESAPWHAAGLAALLLMIEAGLKKLPPPHASRLLERIALMAVLFTLWIYLTRCCQATPYAATLVWTVLAFALFGAGLLLRERIYRWFGLGILTATLLRVAFVDLWGFGTLMRIGSLMALAGVLIGLGYVYNRYADTIKKYL